MELLRGVSAANNFVLALVPHHLRGFFSSSITAHVAAAASATSTAMCKYREGQHSSHRPGRGYHADPSTCSIGIGGAIFDHRGGSRGHGPEMAKGSRRSMSRPSA